MMMMGHSGGGGARSDLKPAEIMETGLSTISQA